MRQFFRFRIVVVLSLIFFVVISAIPASAMTVSPVRIELSGDPGHIIQSSFKITNDEQETKKLYTVFENFEALGETGTPHFTKAKEGLATWLRAPSEIEITAGETKTVDFSVEIPAVTEPGGYFAAIFLSSVPPASTPGEVAIGSRIGSLVLFRVNGDIKTGGSLLEFATKDKKKVYSALPINFYYRFNNTGADRVLPKGSLTIKNTIGLSSAIIDVNPSQGNVLPDSIRRFEIWWRSKHDTEAVPKFPPENQSFIESVKYQWNNFAFGHYSARLAIDYGNADPAKATFSLWVFPWQLLLVELIILLLLFIILRFGLRRYNKWIIKRARS